MQVHVQLIVISAHLMVPSMPEHNNGVNSPTTNAKLKRYIYCQKIIHYIIIIICYYQFILDSTITNVCLSVRLLVSQIHAYQPNLRIIPISHHSYQPLLTLHYIGSNFTDFT